MLRRPICSTSKSAACSFFSSSSSSSSSCFIFLNNNTSSFSSLRFQGTSSSSSSSNYYQDLDVSPSSSHEEIVKSYRKLALKYHPDVKGGDTGKFQKISEAYNVLSNKEKRQQYDAMRSSPFGPGGPFGGGGGQGSGYANPGGTGGFNQSNPYASYQQQSAGGARTSTTGYSSGGPGINFNAGNMGGTMSKEEAEVLFRSIFGSKNLEDLFKQQGGGGGAQAGGAESSHSGMRAEASTTKTKFNPDGSYSREQIYTTPGGQRVKITQHFGNDGPTARAHQQEQQQQLHQQQQADPYFYSGSSSSSAASGGSGGPSFSRFDGPFQDRRAAAGGGGGAAGGGANPFSSAFSSYTSSSSRSSGSNPWSSIFGSGSELGSGGRGPFSSGGGGGSFRSGGGGFSSNGRGGGPGNWRMPGGFFYSQYPALRLLTHVLLIVFIFAAVVQMALSHPLFVLIMMWLLFISRRRFW